MNCSTDRSVQHPVHWLAACARTVLCQPLLHVLANSAFESEVRRPDLDKSARQDHDMRHRHAECNAKGACRTKRRGDTRGQFQFK